MTEHCIVTIDVVGSYPLKCRYWKAENAVAQVIFVHGIVSHSSWLESIAEGLASNGISCLGMDRRGAGLNDLSRGDAPDAAALLGDLERVLQWSETSSLPCHLCGFCWGANYVVNYLSSHTHGARSVMLLAPSLFPSERITAQPLLINDSSIPSETPVMPIECFTDGPAFETFIKPDPMRLKRVSPRLNGIMSEFSRGLWMKFLRLEIPVLVILGEDDEVVDNVATARVFERLSNSRKSLHHLPGKHGLQFDAPESVIRHLHHWISGDSMNNSIEK